MMDALCKEHSYIESIQPRVIAEIGCGSGVVISFLAKYFHGVQCFCTDINSDAVRLAMQTAAMNGVSLEAAQADMLGPFESRLHHGIDVLVFNPPYVPTEDAECHASQVTVTPAAKSRPRGEGIVAATWAGGEDGMQVTRRFLGLLDHFLTSHGLAYVVLMRENNPRQVAADLKRLGFVCSIVMKRFSSLEHLYIMRIRRDPSPAAAPPLQGPAPS
ncbi:putative S-adenosyl-L-methionine-dependent methyltransferase [Paratrimastix pyriformis]|uniref:S-adenosyl-L-methionine-dependent methyltransferase n=1 Tax=Paratrimastix pyriformis TaxID=342808 RepID=A0ABQ8UUA9_9EUKA|nr:putative S-adenosyl-L-methionine-dependent methyltransferase [Paratrimastix pyriformis]